MSSRKHDHLPSRPGRPRGPRRDREERRAELLDAAARAIRRIGPHASMDELAAEAGITKPILYSHFGDRAGLVRALAERVAGDVNRAVTTQLTSKREPVEVLSSTIEAFCTFIETEPELYRFLVQTAMHSSNAGGGSAPRLSNDISRQIAVSLGGALRRAGADSGAAEPWAFGIVGMTFAGAGWWLERRSMSKEDLVGYLTQLLWTGLSGAGLGRVEPEPAAAADGGDGPSASVTPLHDRDRDRPAAAHD